MANRTVAHRCCPGIEMLDQYMRLRAAFEGVPYELSAEFLQTPFDLEVRSFLGVRGRKNGIVRDYHYPETFAAWLGRH